MGVFNSMLAVSQCIWTAIGRLPRPSSIQVYSKCFLSLCSLALLGTSIFFSLYTIYPLNQYHSTSHAADAACSVSRLINENSSKEGEGIKIK